MRFDFLVSVEVERTEGKFASREEVEEQLREAIESADPGTVDGVGSDGTTAYEVTDWQVEEQPQPKPARRPKAATLPANLRPAATMETTQQILVSPDGQVRVR